jgi:predicted Zn-ribbon and HTH transcriptional regulator
MNSSNPTQNFDRIYESCDTTAKKSLEYRLLKDMGACRRCGFSLKQIEKSLRTTKNNYSIIINKEE